MRGNNDSSSISNTSRVSSEDTTITNEQQSREKDKLLENALRLLNEVEPRLKAQESLQWRILTLVIVSFIVLLITVAGIVISNVIAQIQLADEASNRTSERLDSINTRLDEIQYKNSL